MLRPRARCYGDYTAAHQPGALTLILLWVFKVDGLNC
jgi:hypothetical protein